MSQQVSRRLQMVVLSSAQRNSLESVKKLTIKAASDDEVLNHFSKQFLPIFRLHNPLLQVDTASEGGDNKSSSIFVTYSNDSTANFDIPKTCHELAQIIIDHSHCYLNK